MPTFAPPPLSSKVEEEDFTPPPLSSKVEEEFVPPPLSSKVKEPSDEPVTPGVDTRTDVKGSRQPVLAGQEQTAGDPSSPITKSEVEARRLEIKAANDVAGLVDQVHAKDAKGFLELSPNQVADAWQWVKHYFPTLNSENRPYTTEEKRQRMIELRDAPVQMPTDAQKVLTGAINAQNRMTAAMKEPQNAAALAIGAAGPALAARAVSAFFATTMAMDTPELYGKALEASYGDDPQQKTEKYIELGLNGLFVALAGMHATQGKWAGLKEDIGSVREAIGRLKGSELTPEEEAVIIEQIRAQSPEAQNATALRQAAYRGRKAARAQEELAAVAPLTESVVAAGEKVGKPVSETAPAVHPDVAALDDHFVVRDSDGTVVPVADVAPLTAAAAGEVKSKPYVAPEVVEPVPGPGAKPAARPYVAPEVIEPVKGPSAPYKAPEVVEPVTMPNEPPKGPPDGGLGGTAPPVVEMQRGSRFTAAGQEFEVWKSRGGTIEAHPVVNGKPVVNRDTTQRFSITQEAKLRNPEDRTDLLNKGDQNAIQKPGADEKVLQPAQPEVGLPPVVEGDQAPGATPGARPGEAAPERPAPDEKAVEAAKANPSPTPPKEVTPELNLEGTPEPGPTTTVFAPVKEVVEVPLDQIHQSPDVPNFKEDANPDTGVVPGQELAGKFSRDPTLPITLWERLGGRLEVITGRHRLDLARRSGEKTIPAQIKREADGFTKAQALTFDAEANIRDGQGSAKDYAHYFRNSQQRLTEAEAKARGLLSRAKGKAGFDLGQHASDDLFALYVGDKISEAQALAIVRAAPGNGAAQRVGAKYALEGKAADFVGNVVKAALSNTGGRPQAMDLFGDSDAALQMAEEQAKRAGVIQRDLREQIQAIKGAAKNPEAARKLGVNVDDPEAVRAKLAALQADLARWDNWPMQPDLVAQTRGEVAAPPVIEAPKLRPGEKGTGDMLQGADAPFNLAGETIADPARIAQEKAAKEKAAADAKAAADRDQGQMFGGMGAAVPSEFAQGSPTAMKYRLLDEERQKRGLPPLTKSEKITDRVTMDKAMAKVDQDPGYAERLVQTLLEKPRAIEDWERLTLLLRKIDLKGEYDQAVSTVNEFYKQPTRRAEVPEASARAVEFSRQLSELEKASKLSGSATGRALRSLRIMADEFYDLHAMESATRAMKNGDPITDAERAALIKMREDYLAKVKELEDYKVEAEKRAADQAMKMALADLALKAAKETPKASPHIIAMAERIQARWKAEADEARQFLKGKSFDVTSLLDPKVLLAILKVARDRITTDGVEFTKWSKGMIDELGPKIEKYLPDLFTKVQDLMAKEYDRVVPVAAERKKVKAVVEKTPGAAKAPKTAKADLDDPGQRRERIVENLEAKVDAGKMEDLGDIGRMANELALTFVEEGITEREALVDAVHGVLSDILPDITREETEHAISFYGKFKPVTADPAKYRLAQIRGEIQSVLGIADMMAGRAKKPTGQGRVSPSDEKRRLVKIENELKKLGGYEVTNPAQALKSALDTRKTYYTNRLKDLKSEIAARQKVIKKRNLPPTDAELDAMIAEYEVVKAEHDGIFQAPELTEEQRIQRALAGVERQEAELTRQIKERDFSKEKREALKGPALDAAKARVEALREEKKLLMDADAGVQAERAAIELAKVEMQASEVERKINEGDIAVTPQAPPKISTAQLVAARGELTDLNKVLAKLRRAAAAKTTGEIEAKAIADIEARIEEVARQINEGDIAAKVPAAKPTSAEMTARRGELTDLNKVKQKLRNAAKPKKTRVEIALQAKKTWLRRELADLLDRVAREDPTPKPKAPPIELDHEAIRLEGEVEKARADIEELQIKARLASRTLGEKIADAMVSWARTVKLSSLTVFPKLVVAGISKLFSEPAYRLGAQPLRLIPGFSARAPSRLRWDRKAETAGLVALLRSGPQAWRKLRTGRSDIDVMGGKEQRNPEMMGMVGNSHGMVKEPFRQLEYARSMEYSAQEARRMGVDPNEPATQAAIISRAVADANNQIFMGDNLATKYLVRLPINALKGSKIRDAAALARVMEFLMPIVNVPTNIAIASARLNPAIGFGEAAIRLMNAARRGELKNRAATLPEADAVAITRAFSAGMIGTVLAAYAWLNPQMFGGDHGEPLDKKRELKPGEVKILGHTMPAWLNHTPEVNFLNVVASASRVYHRYYKKDQNAEGNAEFEALAFSLMAPVKNLPFIDTWLRLFNDYKSPGRTAGAVVRDAAIPGAITRGLEWADDQKRAPKTFTDELKMGVPGLRDEVPVKR